VIIGARFSAKKTAFHEVQGVHAKAAGILGINTPEQLMNETPSATQNVMLRSQMKGLFVEIRNNQARVFQIAGITSTSALTQA
jgi:calcineurin-like phosphoesterase